MTPPPDRTREPDFTNYWKNAITRFPELIRIYGEAVPKDEFGNVNKQALYEAQKRLRPEQFDAEGAFIKRPTVPMAAPVPAPTVAPVAPVGPRSQVQDMFQDYLKGMPSLVDPTGKDRSPLERTLGMEEPISALRAPYKKGQEVSKWLGAELASGMAKAGEIYRGGLSPEEEATRQELLAQLPDPPVSPAVPTTLPGQIRYILEKRREDPSRETFSDFLKRRTETAEIKGGRDLNPYARFVADLLPAIAFEATLTPGGGFSALSKSLRSPLGGLVKQPGFRGAMKKAAVEAIDPIVAYEEVAGSALKALGRRVAAPVARAVTGTRVDPAIQEAVGVVPGWQKTRAEFRKPVITGVTKDGRITTTDRRADAHFHRSLVRDALAKGKPVPSKVLKDYPDLVVDVPLTPTRAADVPTAAATQQFQGPFTVSKGRTMWAANLTEGDKGSSHIIRDATGKTVGNVEVIINRAGSAEINAFTEVGGDPFASTARGGFGVSGIRQIGSEILRLHPEIKEFRGIRGIPPGPPGSLAEFPIRSGARQAGAEQRISADVFRRSDVPVTPTQAADVPLTPTIGRILPNRIQSSILRIRAAVDEGVKTYRKQGAIPDEVGGIPRSEIPTGWRAGVDPQLESMGMRRPLPIEGVDIDDMNLEVAMEARAERLDGMAREMEKRGVKVPSDREAFVKTDVYGEIEASQTRIADFDKRFHSAPGRRTNALLFDAIARRHGGKSIADEFDILFDLPPGETGGRLDLNRFTVDWDTMGNPEAGAAVSRDAKRIMDEVEELLYNPAPAVPKAAPTTDPIGKQVVSDIFNLGRTPSKFTRADKWTNISRIALGKIGIHRPLLHEVVTPMFRDRKRIKTSVESSASVFGEAMGGWARTFERDAKGGITRLSGVNPDIPGAPTIQDVAARLPTFWSSLTLAERKAITSMRQLADEYSTLRDKYGIGVEYTKSRKDVMEDGFYLSRGKADGEDSESPVSHVIRGRHGSTIDKPTVFSSQAFGISEGWEYHPFEEVMTAYGRDIGYRVRDANTAQQMKTLRDEVGSIIGGTPKTLAMKRNPGIVAGMDRMRKQISALRSTKLRLIEKTYKNFEEFLNDPEAESMDSLYLGMREIENSVKAKVKRGSLKGADVDHVNRVIRQLGIEIDELRPAYQQALRNAKNIRGRGPIKLDNLSNWTFPDEVGAAANEVLEAEKSQVWTAPGIKHSFAVVEFVNRTYRGLGATMDLSNPMIQGLLLSYQNPELGASAIEISIKAFGSKRSERILASFFNDFDDRVVSQGRLSVKDWAALGLHIGGDVSEYQLTGWLQKVPLVQRSNRAFGVAGDSMRLQGVDDELVRQMAKGRSLREMAESGDLERIANSVNDMTGWSPTRTFGAVGDLLFFAPRFLQSRLNTIARGFRSFGPEATLDELMARRALIRMIAYGITLTVGLNMAFAPKDVKGRVLRTDFRPTINGKRNTNFLRVFSPVGDISLFGTWDSLLGAMINIMSVFSDPTKPDPKRAAKAFRGISGGSVSIGWDIISGEDFLGRPTFKTPEHFMHWILRTLTPFAAEEAVPAAVDIAKGAYKKEPSEIVKGAIVGTLELGGVKRTPPSMWEEEERLGRTLAREIGVGDTFEEIQTTRDYKGNFWDSMDMDRVPKHTSHFDPRTQMLLQKDPGYALIQQKAREGFGDPRPEDVLKDELKQQLVKLWKESEKADPKHPGRAYRIGRGKFFDSHHSKLAFIYRDKDKDKDKDEHIATPFEEAEYVYNGLLYADDKDLFEKLITNSPSMKIRRPYTSLKNELGEMNWHERDRRLDYLRAEFGEQYLTDMKEFSLVRQDLPAGELEYRKDMNTIQSKGYWDAPNILAQRADQQLSGLYKRQKIEPNLVTNLLNKYEELKGAGEIAKAREFLEKAKILTETVMKDTAKFRKLMRARDIELEDLIQKYYDYKPIR